MKSNAHAMPCLRAVLAMALLAATTLARSEVMDLAWTPSGSFERKLTVAPGQFAELCGPLAKGQSVQWRFEAGAALDFNIHYHQGNDVIYPARASGVARSDGTLAVDVAQDYCWMWTNKSASAVELKVQLQRR
jgi:hypothetical protein